MDFRELDKIVKAPLTEDEYARMPDVMTDKRMKFFDVSSYSASFHHENLGLPMWILPDGRMLMSRRPHSYIWFAFSDERKNALLERYGKDKVFPRCSWAKGDPFGEDEIKRDVFKAADSLVVSEIAIWLGLVRTGFVNGCMMASYGLQMTRAQFDSICDLADAAKRRWTAFKHSVIEQFDWLEPAMSRIYTDEDEFRVRFLNDVRNSCRITG